MSKLEVALVAFALALISLGIGLAHAHKAPTGWSYDPFCCNLNDCRQLSDGDVEETDGGWVIKSMGVTVPYKHNELRISGDNHYHVCELPKGTVRCFYVPPGGV